MDGLWTKALCPNTRTASSALRYNCIAWAPCLTGEMICCVSPEQQSQQYGRRFLMVFVPVTNRDAVSPSVEPVENPMILPQNSFDLPSDMAHNHRYGKSRRRFRDAIGQTRCLVSRRVCSLHARNNKGKWRRTQPSGTTSPKDTCPA